MRWRRLVPRKVPRVRIVTKAWLLEHCGELASMDDLAAVEEVIAANVKTRGSLRGCG
jgi:hypothetical protein